MQLTESSSTRLHRNEKLSQKNDSPNAQAKKKKKKKIYGDKYIKGCLGELQLLLAVPPFSPAGLEAAKKAEGPSVFLKMSQRFPGKPWRAGLGREGKRN